MKTLRLARRSAAVTIAVPLTLSDNPMTDQLTLTVRALQDRTGGIVTREDGFLLVNMSVVDDGKPIGIVAVDFQGDEIPATADLSHELLIVGNYTQHPKYGQQFAVAAWAINHESTVAAPRIRHRKARRLSAEELRRLTGKDPGRR